MNGIYRLLGTAVAVAVGAVAVSVVSKLLKDSSPLYVENVEGAEPAETDPEAAAEVAAEYAEAQAEEKKNEEAKNAGEKAAPEADEAAPKADPAPEVDEAAPKAAPAAPVTAEAAEADPVKAAYEGAAAAQPSAFEQGAPNANPVMAGKPEAPRDEKGKFDPSKIATPDDFGDWESLGCQG